VIRLCRADDLQFVCAIINDAAGAYKAAIARTKALIEPHEPVSLWRFEVRRLG
jgi:hypothetical protein